MDDLSTFAADRIRPLIRVRQIRDFADRAVSPAELDAIADVARWSGSSSNTQPWRFVLVRQRDTIRRLAEAPCPRRERSRQRRRPSPSSSRTRPGGLSPMPTTKAEPRSGSSSPRPCWPGSGHHLDPPGSTRQDPLHPRHSEGRFVRTIVAIGHRAKRRAHRSRPRARPGCRAARSCSRRAGRKAEPPDRRPSAARAYSAPSAVCPRTGPLGTVRIPARAACSAWKCARSGFSLRPSTATKEMAEATAPSQTELAMAREKAL